MNALAEELAEIALGDVCASRRARRVLNKLAEEPVLSIPSAWGGCDGARGAYRLLDHPEVTAEKVVQPHAACTRLMSNAALRPGSMGNDIGLWSLVVARAV